MESGDVLDELTPAGAYTIDIIRLNRDSLRMIRRNRRCARQVYAAALQTLRGTLDILNSKLGPGASQENAEKYAKLSMLVDAYETFISRRPFFIANLPPEIPQDIIGDL